MSSGRGALPLGQFDHGLPSPPSGLHRWLGGPCRELGDEEKMWGRWRTCRETAARKAWRGGSILNGLSTDLIHGLVLGGEWTDRCRCCSAGWVVQGLAAACSSEKERKKKGPRARMSIPLNPFPLPLPAMGPTTRSERPPPPSSHNGTPLSNDSVELRDETLSDEESGGCPEGTQSELWEHKMRRSLSLSARVERGTNPLRSQEKKRGKTCLWCLVCSWSQTPIFPGVGRVGGRHGPFSNTGTGFLNAKANKGRRTKEKEVETPR